MKTVNGKKVTRLLGKFLDANGTELFGELKIKADKTNLRLHSDKRFNAVDVTTIKGISYSGEYLTLVNCNGQHCGVSSSKDGSHRFHANIFPHHVILGPSHLDTDSAAIKAIEFKVTDLATLFYDYSTFGHVIDSSAIIDTVLAEARKHEQVLSGDYPWVLYYSGKEIVAEVDTAFGKISIEHRPGLSSGSPAGVRIDNTMIVRIEPSEKERFATIMQKVNELSCFFSMMAGKAQGVKRIRLEVESPDDEHPAIFSVAPSFPLERGDKTSLPLHTRDMPLDPVRHPEEFNKVLSSWADQHEYRHFPRWQYVGCIRKGRVFDYDRLIAAANMFDILPANLFPSQVELASDIAEAKTSCILTFKALPASPERDSILGALGRMGKPSLTQKILSRLEVVNSMLGKRLEGIEHAVVVAVKLRNYFVHGSNGGLDINKIEPFLAFLTDTLECIFLASELIDIGWDAKRWLSNHHSQGHILSVFIRSFSVEIAELRLATAKQQ